MDVSPTHACAISINSGFLSCWGNNTEGQCDVPDEFQFNNIFTGVGVQFSCSINELVDGNYLYCWGQQEGDRNRPWNNLISENLKKNVDYLTVGSQHACFIKMNKQDNPHQKNEFKILLQCFGRNDQGQSTLPSFLTESTFTDIGAGFLHTCVILQSFINCWGDNSKGQLDVQQSRMWKTMFQAVDVGMNHNCGLTMGGYRFCWGSNEYGQTDVPPNTIGVEVWGTGGNHNCQSITNGGMQCFGMNLNGQCNIPIT